MLQYRCDEQGGPQPPKPPSGWKEPVNPAPSNKPKENEPEQEHGKEIKQ
jgi:hypothetical protein